MPKICATIPFVGGTVDNHNIPKVIPKNIDMNNEGGKNINMLITIALKKYNKLSNPINNNTREIVQLNKAFGKVNYFEIRGEGELRSKWFEAEISEKNTAEVQLIKELDIFDTPSVFSKDYGDQDKIKELIDEKNLEIVKQNEMSANISSNMQTTYVLTAKGKKDMEDQKQDLMVAHEKATVASGSHGGMSGGGGGC